MQKYILYIELKQETSIIKIFINWLIHAYSTSSVQIPSIKAF